MHFISKSTLKMHCAKNLNQRLKFLTSDFCSCPLITVTSNLTSNQNRSITDRNERNQRHLHYNLLSKRHYSTKGTEPIRRLPPLMTFPEIVWPSIIKSLRNFILTTFIIKPYFDKEFSLQNFVAGSKKAVEVVSNKLAEGDLNALDGLVTNDIIPDLQRAISQMSLSQRQHLAIQENDIYFSFPYQIGIMFEDPEPTAIADQNQKRFVEITMVYHSFRDLEAVKSRGEELPLNVGMLPQYRDNISICNYRFIREFTKGVDSGWTINLFNHFKPSDYVDE